MAYCKECIEKHNIEAGATTYYVGIKCRICNKEIKFKIPKQAINSEESEQ